MILEVSICLDKPMEVIKDLKYEFEKEYGVSPNIIFVSEYMIILLNTMKAETYGYIPESSYIYGMKIWERRDLKNNEIVLNYPF